MELRDYLRLPYTVTLKPDEDGDWIARVQEFEGCLAHGATQAEALERLEIAKRQWVEASIEHGMPIPEPAATESLPRGKWLQRAPRSLQKQLQIIARSDGTSFNQLVVSALSEYVGRRASATTGFVALLPPGHIFGMPPGHVFGARVIFGMNTASTGGIGHFGATEREREKIS